MFKVKFNITLILAMTVFGIAPLKAQNVVKFGYYDVDNIPDSGGVGHGFGKPNPPTPEGSIISKTEYWIIIDDQGDPSNFRCADYQIVFNSTIESGHFPSFSSGDLIYDTLGGATDGGFDDDAPDDSDIFLFRRESHFFDGETPNQFWYVHIRDVVAGKVGRLIQAEIYVYYTFHDFFSSDAKSVSPDHVYPGEVLDISWRITNAAGVASDRFSASFYASADTNITPDDYLLQTVSVSSLTSSKTLLETIPVPDIPSGQYYIGLILDSTDRITESDETNNTSYVGPIQIGAETLYVDDDGFNDPGPNDLDVSDPNEDGSMDHPYDSIQEAIDAASDGGVIQVRSGTYWETIDFNGKSIQVKGGEPNQPCPIIDANYTDTVVTFTQGEDANTLLSGFTLTRGQGDLAGGILCDGSHPLISNCLLVGNRSLNQTGGGGAVYCHDSNAVFNNCTLSGNYGGPFGAGFLSDESHAVIINSILWDNSPFEILTTLSGGLPPEVSYSDVGTNAAGMGNLNADPLFIQPGYWADPLQSQNPLAPSEGNVVWMSGDYHLQATSPCIDSGEPNHVVAGDALDCDGEPRVHNARIDMGVDEYRVNSSTILAIYQNTEIVLALDANEAVVGHAPITLDLNFKAQLLAQAVAASAAGGTWTAWLVPDVLGPGLGLVTELWIKGEGVDLNMLPGQGEHILANVTLLAAPAP